MTAGPADRLLGEAERLRVAVAGDFCLDAYWELAAKDTDQSVETGLPVRHVDRARYSLGGAGNVVANLAALGVADLRVVGMVGPDLFGRELLRLLAHVGANTSGMVETDATWQTQVYAKPLRAGVEKQRLDFGTAGASPEAVDLLIKHFRATAAEVDVVIVNQQVVGSFGCGRVVEAVNDVIAAAGIPFVVDARHAGPLYRGAVLKLNEAEAHRALGRPVRSGGYEDLRECGRALRQTVDAPVVITRGERGMVVFDEDGDLPIWAVDIPDRTDTVGAGDTAVAALALGLGIGASVRQAAQVANLAASVTVRKLRTTGTVSPEELRAASREPDYRYEPDLAADPRRARHGSGTAVELIRDLPKGPVIRHVIFDHDGTLSTLRQGWELVMAPMMVDAVLGPRADDVSPEEYDQVREAVDELIARTTGVQTITQMQHLISLIETFEYVPRDEMLDPLGYKKVYNDELMKMVRRRTDRVRAGELNKEDFHIKNAHAFVQRLHDAGVTLYLASGTDTDDVRAEARLLGYGHLFGGRIYGATGRVGPETKKVVIDDIIRHNNLREAEFATFGDGPVEIRETHKRSGVAIGVCSDEVRRYGFNLQKRRRLITAGADALIPDYSRLSSVLSMIGLS